MQHIIFRKKNSIFINHTQSTLVPFYNLVIQFIVLSDVKLSIITFCTLLNSMIALNYNVNIGSWVSFM